MGALVTDGAIAQPSGQAIVWNAKAKFADDYNARKFKAVIADATALEKLNAMDADSGQVTAQAYYLSRNKPGCVKYIQEHFSSPMPERTAQLLKRCQTS